MSWAQLPVLKGNDTANSNASNARFMVDIFQSPRGATASPASIAEQ
jgi:hypothetical protein